MSLETMASRMGDTTNRRGVLARLGAAGLASAAWFAGVKTQEAHAICTTHGCDFCECPSSCSRTCQWCWWGRCHTHNDGSRRRHLCCEGYGPVSSSNCSGQCAIGLICSFYGSSQAC